MDKYMNNIHVVDEDGNDCIIETSALKKVTIPPFGQIGFFVSMIENKSRNKSAFVLHKSSAGEAINGIDKYKRSIKTIEPIKDRRDMLDALSYVHRYFSIRKEESN